MTNTIIITSAIKNGQLRDLDNIWHKTKINKTKAMSNRNPAKQKTKNTVMFDISVSSCGSSAIN
jgi:hypothetical protein